MIWRLGATAGALMPVAAAAVAADKGATVETTQPLVLQRSSTLSGVLYLTPLLYLEESF